MALGDSIYLLLAEDITGWGKGGQTIGPLTETLTTEALVANGLATVVAGPGVPTPAAPYVDGQVPVWSAALGQFVPANPSGLAPFSTPGLVASHRGYGGSWNGYSEGAMGGLEESLLAIRSYIAKATTLFRGVIPTINIHVQALSDGTLVLMHDATVNRTTSGTGNVTDFDLSAWSLLTLTPAAQAGYAIAAAATQQPPTLLQVLMDFGGKAHFIIEATAAVAGAIAALVQSLGLSRCVTVNSFSSGQLAIAAAAGLATQYNPPNLGSAGSDAATIAALPAWAGGATKHVSVNYQPSKTLTVTTVSGSAAVTVPAGFTGLNGWNIKGNGIPFGTTITVVDDTHATLSQNATASAAVTGSLWPTQALMTTYIQSLVTAGLTVTAYIVDLRSDMAWLSAAGVTHFISDEAIYLVATAQIRSGTQADPTTKGAWPDGVLLADPVLPNQSAWGRGNIANGGHSLDKVLAAASEMHLIRGDVSYLGAVPATYTVRTDFTFHTMPSDTTRWLAVRFGCTSDANFSDNSTFGGGFQDGYMVLVRGNGQMAVFRHNKAGGTATQLGATQTMTTVPTADAQFRLKIAVTAANLTVSVVDSATETTVYATVTVADATFRGGYIGVGKAEGAASTHVAVFRNLQAA